MRSNSSVVIGLPFMGSAPPLRRARSGFFILGTRIIALDRLPTPRPARRWARWPAIVASARPMFGVALSAMVLNPPGVQFTERPSLTTGNIRSKVLKIPSTFSAVFGASPGKTCSSYSQPKLFPCDFDTVPCALPLFRSYLPAGPAALRASFMLSRAGGFPAVLAGLQVTYRKIRFLHSLYRNHMHAGS